MLDRDLFLLDKDLVFLNHGSFGACPKPVFAQYQEWQMELERQPVSFYRERYDKSLDEARAILGDYIHARAEDLIFVQNATIGLNTVARSLKLNAGDEILTTDHEYGAMELMMQFVAKQTGAKVVYQAVTIPYVDDEEFVENLWKGVTARTKIIFLSHITSPTALIFPVEAVCQRARQEGIFTMVDGAHVPGQLELDLSAIGADVYSGNCHKWLCAPKGAGFLHVREEHQAWIDPLVISWHSDEEAFAVRNQWQGTRDVAAFLSVPAAIQFQADHNWGVLRQACHELALSTQARICDDFGLDPLSTEQFEQMVSIPLPDCDTASLKIRLYDEFRIEVPMTAYKGKPYVRVSFQAYNTPADAQALINALHQILD